ncbi:TRAP transporter small permease [Yoonia vestfoldensis]|jgi:TRAP-type C4-dicarboxylate transport system permease small subunit|uniref:TRAP transporter small permease protein n=1 Tax=Yoonia vestfoldensis TaxID=245188 RepID=A0A1Y0ECF9_9RHOB|nr:TRAP transporter small permease [Yoonia vestfoldensis]ARU01188.1 sialic acid TRAP transporter permease protein SiaT [Yoonia vestfoldensis]
MQQRMIGIAGLLGLLARGALWVAGIALVAMTALVAAQVFARYVVGAPLTWTEPTSILLMGWFILLGAAVGTREGYHLSFDVLLMVLPQRIVRVLHSVSDLVVAGFGAGMAWFGFELLTRTWTASMPTLGLPGGVAFIPLTLSGVLIVIFSAERLARRAAGLKTARFGDEVTEE